MPDISGDIIIPAGTAQSLISAHDGDMALLWLFRASAGTDDVDAAAAALCRTGNEIRAASEKLARMGLIPAAGQSAPASAAVGQAPVPAQPVRSVPQPSDDIPQYSADDIAARSKTDSAFPAIVEEAVRVRGKSLTTADLKTLFGIYDYYGLPADVIFLLLNYCAETNAERNGPGRLLTMNYIKNEAVRWVNANVTDCERAEDYIRDQKNYFSRLSGFSRVIGIYGRELVPTERTYISDWINMGFSEDAVAAAYDRTVAKCGKRELKYMNAILRRWHEAGLHTLPEIEAAEGRPARGFSPAGNQSAADIDIESLAAELDKRI